MIRHLFFKLFTFLLCAGAVMSCKSYKQNYMFRYDEDDLTNFKIAVNQIERNYVISPNDILELNVFTHNGERIIDPDFELRNQGNNNMNNNNQQQRYNEFRVLQDSTIKLPLLGHVKLVGMTIDEAETYLQERYSEFYSEPFVNLKYSNKRVIVLGGVGGQIVYLQDEKINLLEVLALAGGINEDSKAQNIRIIRGDLHQPEVYLVDLSTIKGMTQSIVPIEPGDIVYVEPHRKVVTETLRDFTLVLATVTSLVSMVVLIRTL